MKKPLQILSVVLLTAAVSRAQRTIPGISSKKAPAWNVKQWFNLPKGKKKLELSDYAGKVVFLYCFQTWCPGCHSLGFPTLKKLSSEFTREKDVVLVAVQAVFEGFQTNTLAGGRRGAKKFKLDIPFGHDAGEGGGSGRRSQLMTKYRTGGTPWTVLIDRKGIVRYNDFHIKPEAGSKLIKSLLAESLPPEIGPGLAKRNTYATLIGARFEELDQLRWLTQNRKAPDLARHELTLLRWWTVGCPFCKASLPALEDLRSRYAERGLDVVGIFHPKPVRAFKDSNIWKYAREAGFNGTIGADPDWSVLKKLFAKGAPKTATSISILVDRKGIILWVHPGPSLHPSNAKYPKEADKEADRSYAELERLIGIRLDLAKKKKRSAKVKRSSSRKSR